MSSNYINDRVMKNMKREVLFEFYNAYMETSNEIIENLAFEKKEDDVKVLDAAEVANSDNLPNYRIDINHGESIITLTFKGDAEIRKLKKFIAEVDESGYGEYYTLNTNCALICTKKRMRIFITNSIDGFGTAVSFVLAGYARTRLIDELGRITLMDRSSLTVN